MKKIVLLAEAFVALTAVSCKKEKTCSCTVTVTNSNSLYNPTNPDTQTIEYKYGKMKKGEANQVCPTSTTDVVNNNESGAAANIETTTTTCTIK